MTDPTVEIHVTTKVVDERHYEFTYVYGQEASGPRSAPGISGKVVPTGSSTIAPGLAVPIASTSRD